jgi:hypothetical protein
MLDVHHHPAVQHLQIRQRLADVLHQAAGHARGVEPVQPRLAAVGGEPRLDQRIERGAVL